MPPTDSSTEPTETTPTEFFVPATFQFSTDTGNIERIIVGLFHDHSDLEARVVTDEPTNEFYIPAMYQFSTEPGRIERFLKAVFAERDDHEFQTVPETFVDMFYLPASNPDSFRHRDTQDLVALQPTTEVLEEDT